MTPSIAVSGDSIINRRLSTCENDRFLDVVDLFREADVGFTHFESLIHNFDEPEVYPAAEGGGTWMRSPPYVAEELGWAGFDIVSHASNHALDYGYGGLEETWRALDEAEIPHAGTGKDLGDARSPAYVETDNLRTGLVSMTSSFTRWSRAGEARTDMKGRPGINPLRLHHEVDAETMESIQTLAKRFGWWITRVDDEVLVNKPGIHNTMKRYVEVDDVDGARMFLHERDVERNLKAIADAAHQADLAIGHLHTHEFDPDGDITIPPACFEEFARQCIDAGADVMVLQGSHAPLRGIEIYRGSPIFYDPGDLFFMSDTTSRLPAEFYYRHEHDLDAHPHDATPSEGFAARGLVDPWGDSSEPDDGSSFGADENLLNPPGGGLFIGPGSVVPVCSFDEDLDLEQVTINPVSWFKGPKGLACMPKAVTGEEAESILTHLADLSAEYGTTISVDGSVGTITVD